VKNKCVKPKPKRRTKRERELDDNDFISSLSLRKRVILLSGEFVDRVQLAESLTNWFNKNKKIIDTHAKAAAFLLIKDIENGDIHGEKKI
jgi:hypothetical protein